MKKMFLFKFGKIFVKPVRNRFNRFFEAVHGKPVSKMAEI
jgi:hypothetical protein